MVISIIKEVADELRGCSCRRKNGFDVKGGTVTARRGVEDDCTSIKKHTDKEVGHACPDPIMPNREMMGSTILVLVVIEEP